MDDLTDRDRLALAFDDLAQQDYLAPIDFAWTVCCNRCGIVSINHLAQVGSLPNPHGFVFWHAQKDEEAFYPGGSSDMPAVVATAIDEAGIEPALDGEEEAMVSWMEEHTDFVEAAYMEERMSKYNKLLAPLFLHWGGDSSVIVARLRARGLHAIEPGTPDRCIGVFPVE